MADQASGSTSSVSGGIPAAKEPERPLEELAAGLGPFSPPREFQFEPEFAPQAPRPIPAALRAGSYARGWRRNFVTIICIGLICLAFAHVGLVRELGYYLLPLAHLDWVAYGLFALAAIILIKYHATGDRYKYVRDGIPFVARILHKTYVVKPMGEVQETRMLAGVDYRNPETQQIGFAWICSDPLPGLSCNKEHYQPPYEVGDYVTAVYMPGKFEKTARIYSLLGLNPDIGFILKNGVTWQPGMSVFTAMCIIIGIIAAILLLLAGLYAFEFCMPKDFSGHDVLTKVVPVGAVLGVLFAIGMVRLGGREYRRGKTTKPMNPIVASLVGLIMGFVAGMVAVVAVNAVFDRSPPQYCDVEVVEFWQVTHKGIFREYQIEYVELDSGKKEKIPSRAEYMAKFELLAGVLELHKGFLGMPWVRQVHPVTFQVVDSAASRAGRQPESWTGGDRPVRVQLVVTLENGETMPASNRLNDVVRRKISEAERELGGE